MRVAADVDLFLSHFLPNKSQNIKEEEPHGIILKNNDNNQLFYAIKLNIVKGKDWYNKEERPRTDRNAKRGDRVRVRERIQKNNKNQRTDGEQLEREE